MSSSSPLLLNNHGCRCALFTVAGFLFLLLFNFANTSSLSRQIADVALANFSNDQGDDHSMKVHHGLANGLNETLLPRQQQRRVQRDEEEESTTTEVTNPNPEPTEGGGQRDGDDSEPSEAEQKANCQDESVTLFACLCAVHALLLVLTIAVLVYFCMLRSQTNAAIAYIMGEENGYAGGGATTMMGKLITMRGEGKTTKKGGGSKLGKTTKTKAGGAGTTLGRTTKGGGALTLKGGPKTKGDTIKGATISKAGAISKK